MNTNMWENPIVKQNLKKLSKIKFKDSTPKIRKISLWYEGFWKINGYR